MPALDLDTHLDTDLSAERAHLATSRAALRRMRERAEALFASGDQVAGDAYAAETLGRTLARRVAELADDPTTPLFFGRLDFAGTVSPEATGSDTTASQATGSATTSTATTSTATTDATSSNGDHDGRRYHVGRRHVTDERGEPLVLDWRAPVSRSFYRASARDPQGVAVRRRFGFSNGVLTSFEGRGTRYD
jgi:DNA helicase IV